MSKLQYLSANGVPVAAVSPVNEPSNGNSWTNADIDGFIKVLSPALIAAGFNVPLAMPEWESQFATDFYSACMGDSSCAQDVSYAAEHGYNTWPVSNVHYSAIPSALGSRHAWQTEVNGSVSNPTWTCNSMLPYWDPSISDGIAWAENIHDFLTNQNGSMWMYWNLQSGYSGCNDGLEDTNFNPAKRFYTVGNWSKFIRPGWVRIDATTTPQSGVDVTAFTSQSTGAFAIVAINSNGGPVSAVLQLE